MREVGPDIIDDIFTALDWRIGVRGGMSLGLIVCGGTALYGDIAERI